MAPLTKGQRTALKDGNREVFEALLKRITDATILYLSEQIKAGAEVVKIFDSWAGSLKGDDFINYAVKPAAKITAALKALHPDTPIIAFPRGAGERYIGLHEAIGADCIALDDGVTAEWAAANVQDRRLRAGQPQVVPHGHRRR